MDDIITYIDNNGKDVSYYVSDIHDLYRYLKIIRSPTTLTYSRHNSNSFVTKINPDSGYLHPVISYLRVVQRIIFECFGKPGHKE